MTNSVSNLKLLRSYDPLKTRNRIKRWGFGLVWNVLAHPFPRRVGSGWKRFLLRLFGANIHATAIVYSTAKIYDPANLKMDEYSCLASNVICYNVDYVEIGANATVSQYAYLCTASHDITNIENFLITSPILIKDRAWIAADAFVGMGVTIGQGAVVGARSAVFKDVAPWTVVGGNPAKFIKKRIIE